MNAWNGDAEFKVKFMSILSMHREQDRIIAGTYGEMGPKARWRGCVIGCSLRTLAIMDGAENVDRHWANHDDLAERLSIPLVLARFMDRLFEGMSFKRRTAWPERFADAIAPGADLSGVWDRLALWLLKDSERGVLRLAKSERSMSAIEGVAVLYERKMAGDLHTTQEWWAARAAAYAAYAAAAHAADAAAYAAAYAAHAADAADAYAAAYAAAAADAYAAAYAAAHAAADADAAADAARCDYYDAMADKLIELMMAVVP